MQKVLQPLRAPLERPCASPQPRRAGLRPRGSGLWAPSGSWPRSKSLGCDQRGCCSDVGFSLPSPVSCLFPFSLSLLSCLSRKWDVSCHIFCISADDLVVFPSLCCQVSHRLFSVCRSVLGTLGSPAEAVTAIHVQCPDAPQSAPLTATPAPQPSFPPPRASCQHRLSHSLPSATEAPPRRCQRPHSAAVGQPDRKLGHSPVAGELLP